MEEEELKKEHIIREYIIREYIISVLTEQQEGELKGRGYDFYFKLRTDLDAINRRLNKLTK